MGNQFINKNKKPTQIYTAPKKLDTIWGYFYNVVF